MSNPRITITFTEPQMEYIKAAARRKGITSSELVRKAVDNLRQHAIVAYGDEMPEHIKAYLRSIYAD